MSDLATMRRKLARDYVTMLTGWIGRYALERGVSAPTDGYVPFSHELALVLGWLRRDAAGDHDIAAWERVIDHASAVINDYSGAAALNERDAALMTLRLIVQDALTAAYLDAMPGANSEQLRAVAAFKALTMTDDELMALVR